MTAETVSRLQSPFFIVGCGRSGTTLLRRMLDQHPLIAVPVESLFMIDYLRARDQAPADVFRRLVVEEHEFREWALEIQPDELQGCTDVVALLNHLHERYAAQHGARYWGQKTPRFIRYGELLKQVYPHAKFIHVVRDPRAVVSSLRNSNVHRSNVYYGASRWLKDVEAGAQLKQRYPDDVLEIAYETLIADTERVLRQVAEFLGIGFDAAMLNYHRQQDAAYGAYHAQIHANLQAPPKKDRIDAWRQELMPQEIALVEQICAPLMPRYAYTPEAADVIIPPGMVNSLKWERRTRGLYRQVRQYFRGRTRHLFFSIYRKARLGLLWRDLSQVNY